eukprot:scaffold22821_cov80-Isochrysis_galbana.AAC.3
MWAGGAARSWGRAGTARAATCAPAPAGAWGRCAWRAAAAAAKTASASRRAVVSRVRAAECGRGGRWRRMRAAARPRAQAAAAAPGERQTWTKAAWTSKIRRQARFLALPWGGQRLHRNV